MGEPRSDAISGADIAAIVVSYATGPVLFECVDRLAADPAVAELVVVDNGNPPEVLAALRARPRVTLLTGHGNIGYARGCNLGAARTRAPLLAFINPDALVEPGALAALKAAGARARAPWIVGARILWPDGREQRGARRDEISLWSAFVAGLGLGRFERLSSAFRDPYREGDPAPAGPARVGAVSGAAMLTRRADFERLGGHDERYFLHADDIDLCRRAREAGGEVLFQPEARIIHLRSTSAAPSVFVARHKARGLVRYFFKFARTPAGWVGAAVAAPFVYALVIAPAAMRDLARFIRR